MQLSIQRVNLTGGTTEISFKRVCRKYLVKNFTEGDIFVSFSSDLVEDKAVKIASGMGQVIVINENYAWKKEVAKSVVYIKGTGEVEVQQLCYN